MNRAPALAIVGVAAALVVVTVWAATTTLAGSHSVSADASTTTSASPSAKPTKSSSSNLLTAGELSHCPTPNKTVSTAKELTTALTQAAPGTIIQLLPGRYVGNFVAKATANEGSPIWLCGNASTVLDGGKTKSGYVLHLDHAEYWHLLGFTVVDGQKGVVTDASNHNIIEGLTVNSIGDEGIHVRSASAHNLVTRNIISNTGLLKSKFGEGIYVGSAKSNWCTYSACGPDRSDDNTLSDNSISLTTAENIDVKEGTTGGTISGNTFDGIGMVGSAADSWIDVKGNDWTISSNRGVNSVNDGFQTHEIVSGWGTGNRFTNNTLDVNGPGFGIDLTPSLENTVSCNNSADRAAKGLSNIPCTN